jgi:quinol monooxygenase YgiN
MITVVATNYIKEDKIDDMINIAKELVEETRKEDGCITYNLFQDSEDKGTFTFVEEWTSKEHLDAHMQTEHFTRIVPKIKELCRAEGKISVLNKVY